MFGCSGTFDAVVVFHCAYVTQSLYASNKYKPWPIECMYDFGFVISSGLQIILFFKTITFKRWVFLTIYSLFSFQVRLFFSISIRLGPSIFCSSVSARLKWLFRFKLGMRYILMKHDLPSICQLPDSFFHLLQMQKCVSSNTFHGADSVSDSLSASMLAISLRLFHQ